MTILLKHERGWQNCEQQRRRHADEIELRKRIAGRTRIRTRVHQRSRLDYEAA